MPWDKELLVCRVLPYDDSAFRHAVASSLLGRHTKPEFPRLVCSFFIGQLRVSLCVIYLGFREYVMAPVNVLAWCIFRKGDEKEW